MDEQEVAQAPVITITEAPQPDYASLKGFIENIWPVCHLVLSDQPNVRVQIRLSSDKVSDQAWATRRSMVMVSGMPTRDRDGQVILLDAKNIELAPE